MNKFLIKKPMITERVVQMSQLGKYAFLVDKKSSKPEIKKAVENIYKVNVEKVNVSNTKPKPRQMGRYVGIKAGYRKAIVTLKTGQKLDILPH